jgi:hypothetical protein
MSHKKITLTVHNKDIRSLAVGQTQLILSRYLELYKKATAEIGNQVAAGDKEEAWASYVQLINVLVNTSRELVQIKTLIDEIPEANTEGDIEESAQMFERPSFPGTNNQKD